MVKEIDTLNTLNREYLSMSVYDSIRSFRTGYERLMKNIRKIPTDQYQQQCGNLIYVMCDKSYDELMDVDILIERKKIISLLKTQIDYYNPVMPYTALISIKRIGESKWTQVPTVKQKNSTTFLEI